MGKYQAEAIVIGVHPWGDADKMVSLLTRERGRMKVAAFGARRPRSPLSAPLQLFHHVDVELQEGQKIDTVKACTILRHYKALAEDLTAMSYGAFLAEVAQEFLAEDAQEEAAFDLLLHAFGAMEKRNPRIVALIAAFQLMEHTGMQLSFERCVRCGRKMEGDAYVSLSDGGVVCPSCAQGGEEGFSLALQGFLLRLLEFSWKEQEHFTLKKAELLAAESLLVRYLQGLLGKQMKSLAFLGQLP